LGGGDEREGKTLLKVERSKEKKRIEAYREKTGEDRGRNFTVLWEKKNWRAWSGLQPEG